MDEDAIFWKHEAERLREVLEEVEYISDEVGGHHCAWCYDDYPNHDEDCTRQKALKGGG